MHPYVLAARAAHVTRLALLGGFLTLLAWLLPGTAGAQVYDFTAAISFNPDGIYGTSTGRATATDAAGNQYVTGEFTGTIVLGSATLVSAGGTDVFVAKRSASTGAWLWAVKAGGTSGDIGQGIAVDASGNALVTGYFQGTASFATSPTATGLTSAGNTDVFVARFGAADGACAWAVRAGGTSGDVGQGIAADGSGNALVTGYFQGTASFATSPTATSLAAAGGQDVFVARFGAADGACAWAVRAGGTSGDVGQGIAVDASGNALVTGYFQGTASFATSPTVTSLAAAGSPDVFVARFGAADGACAWAVKAGGTSNDVGQGIAVDAGGNALVTGSFFGTASFATSPTATSLAAAGVQDVFVARFGAADGACAWAVRAGGTSGDVGQGIAVDASGNALVTGSFQGTASFATSPTATSLATAGGQDVFVARFGAADGACAWAVKAGGTGIDVGYGIAADASGNALVTGSYTGTASFAGVGDAIAPSTGLFAARLAGSTGAWQPPALANNGSTSTGRATATDAAGNQYVTGEFTGTIVLGSATLVSAGGTDVFVAKRSASTGAWLWAVRAGGTSNDVGQGIAVDASGNALVTGSFFGTASFATSPTATGLTSAGNTDVFVAKFGAADGACAWAVRAGGTLNDVGYGIAADGSGNALVTGSFTGTVSFATSPTATSLVSAGGIDVFVAKFGASTGACAWAVQAGGGSADTGYGIAADGSGNALVTGYIVGGVSFATSPTATNLNTVSGSSDVFVAKFGTTDGACAWAVRAGGTSTDIGQSIAVDGGGNALITGYFDGTTSFATSPTATSLTTAGSTEVFVAKFGASAGACAWAVRAGGTGADIGYGIAVDASGNALVTGSFNATASFATSPTATSLVSAGSSSDVFVARFGATDGACAWAVRAGGTSGDVGQGIAVDASGNTLVTGSFTSMAAFGSASLVGGAGVATGFAVRVSPVPAPAIISFSPTSGVAGTPVTLTGTNLTGAMSVTVNGVAVTPANVTAATLTFVVPAGASATQSITVTTPSGTSAASTAFTVRLTVVATGTSPAANALTAPVASSALAVGFTEPVTAASAATIKVFSAQAGGLKAGTVTSSGSTARYTSSLGAALRDFRAGETLSVTVPATVQGAGGLALTAPSVYQFTTATAASPGTFAGRTDFGAGTQPYGVALGDVSGDGILDMAVVNDASASASVLLGTGTGSFGPKTDYATGTNPEVVVLGDVNGDGKLDIVTANFGTSNVSVLLNSGTGSFGAHTDFATGTQTRSVALGDVNGDGALDIVTANYGSANVSVLLGTGTGSFGPHADYAAGTSPAGITLGDVNNDGNLDLVVANIGSSNITVLLGTGTGTFGTRTDYATGLNPVGVALGDVNNDGKLDIAVANFGTNANSASVLLNTGSGAFAARTDYATGTLPISVALGDVNGDGKLDLATANVTGGSASVLLGTGTGSFGPHADYTTGTSPASVALADLNGDGTLDLATANTGATTASVLLGLAPPALTAVAPNPGGLGQSITLTGTNLNSPTALTINGANALGTIISNTGNVLVVRVPVTATATGNVSITTAGGSASLAFTVMAPPGNALAFDGVDDYLALPASTPVPLGNAAYTVEAWINANSMNLGSIIGWGNYGTTNQANGLSLYPTGLINYWWANDLQKTTPNLVGRWHHVAATYNGTTRTIYLDGVALGSDVPGVHAVPNAQNLRIGSNSNGAFTYLNGRLDEVRVYSVALTPAQLRADMTSTTAAVPASLVLYYNFDQGTPATASTGDNTGLTTLYDLSNNATPGTLTNFALASGNTTSNYVQSYALVVPTATVSTARSATGFTANWTAPAIGTATSYLLDVSTTPDFASPIAGSPFATTATSYALTGLNPSSPYFYRVRALNSALSPADQGAYSSVIGQATPLPVELSAFTATAEGRAAVRLVWATASEKNSARFEVERSTDGRTFAAIGAVAAAGSSTALRSYELLDATLPASTATLYYRLKQVDQDGSFSYSPVRTVAVAGVAAGLGLYPNPTHGSGATLTGAVPGTMVTVFDALGRVVASATADAAGRATLALPAGLPMGVYVVRAGTKALRLTVE
ncbi:hypothetical protein GCM10022407_26420 [Hymenobacter antarcticus]|uniref:Fibronectin type-III domain-containing protein n=2 Tax=Hymenobacter antarcticus TaxID=486270 RepID=A0ABP7QC90_9BACT